jgi:hypothetical protein
MPTYNSDTDRRSTFVDFQVLEQIKQVVKSEGKGESVFMFLNKAAIRELRSRGHAIPQVVINRLDKKEQRKAEIRNEVAGFAPEEKSENKRLLRNALERRRYKRNQE